MNELQISTAIAACTDHLALQGIAVSEFTDYGRLSTIIEKSNKDYLVPMLCDQRNDFFQANVLWLVGEKENVPVMLGGARLEDLGNETLASFWPRTFSRHYSDGKREIIEDVNPYLSNAMSGKLVYFGDLFSDKRAMGPKRINIRAFTMLGHLWTILRWRQDHTYAFIRQEDMMRGAGFAYGFTNHSTRPFDWLELPHPRSNTEVCAFTDSSSVFDSARVLLKDIQSLRGSDI